MKTTIAPAAGSPDAVRTSPEIGACQLAARSTSRHAAVSVTAKKMLIQGGVRHMRSEPDCRIEEKALVGWHTVDRPRLPAFPFTPPLGYAWLIERGLVGFTPSSALLPWYFVSKEESLALGPALRRGPADDSEPLFAFARREDTDDVACLFERDRAIRIALVHTWTPTGPEVVATYDTIWDWLRAVIDDIEEVVAASVDV